MNPDIIDIYASTFTTLKEWDEGIYNYNTDNYMMKLLIIKQRLKEEGLEAEIHLPEKDENSFPYLDFVRESELGWFDWNVFDKTNSFIVQNDGMEYEKFESESLEEAINLVIKYLKNEKSGD